MAQLEPIKRGYGNLWDICEVTSERTGAADRIAKAIIADKDKYSAVERRTNVPYFVIGALHQRESSRNFSTHLHNGDPLSDRTVHVPPGRPALGNPPFGWDESAIDALEMPPHKLNTVKRWSIERMLYESERYNGFGYLRHAENSPYVWAWTTLQQSGKYVADGRYDPNVWDVQPGVAAILKALADIDPSIRDRLKTRDRRPPEDVSKHETKPGRTTSVAGGAGAAGTAAGTTAVDRKDKTIVHHAAEWTVIGVFVAVVIVGAVMMVRKTKLLKDKWG